MFPANSPEFEYPLRIWAPKITAGATEFGTVMVPLFRTKGEAFASGTMVTPVPIFRPEATSLLSELGSSFWRLSPGCSMTPRFAPWISQWSLAY